MTYVYNEVYYVSVLNNLMLSNALNKKSSCIYFLVQFSFTQINSGGNKEIHGIN